LSPNDLVITYKYRGKKLLFLTCGDLYVISHNIKYKISYNMVAIKIEIWSEKNVSVFVLSDESDKGFVV
jgi:hypothetical protein